MVNGVEYIPDAYYFTSDGVHSKTVFLDVRVSHASMNAENNDKYATGPNRGVLC